MNTNLYQMDVEVKKSRGLMETDLHDYHNQHQNSNLMRYRSAPGSLLASLVSGGCEDLLNDRSSSPEESMFARFISCNGRAEPESPDLHEATTESADGYSNASQRMYQTPSLNRFPNHSSVNSGTPTESSFKSINSVATEVKTSRGNYSNLGRQNSSPPELLSSLTVENGKALRSLILLEFISFIIFFLLFENDWLYKRIQFYFCIAKEENVTRKETEKGSVLCKVRWISTTCLDRCTALN